MKNLDLFNNKLKEQREGLFTALKSKDEKVQAEGFETFVNGLQGIFQEAAKDYAEEFSAFHGKGITAKEVKFFNAINTDVGYKDEKLLPEETVDEIFEDMTTNHPVLEAIGLKNAGLRLKFLKSETSGVAVWGKIFGDIKGQLDAAFSEEEAIQNKLTTFVVVPKDLENYGPVWIKTFVKMQIEEAASVALELAFVTGSGKEQPVGLNRNVAKDAAIVDGVYPEKTPSGTLTFADAKTTVSELTAVHKYHSVKENNKPLTVDGEVVLFVNPLDAWDVKKQYTSLNANGIYVTALPFNLKIVETPAVDARKVISFVAKRYDAYIGGGISILGYDQTLALEDLNLYVGKQFAYGKAKDNKGAALWTLAIPDPEAIEGATAQ